MLNDVAFAPLIKGERGIFGIKYEFSQSQARGKSPVPPLSRGRMIVIPLLPDIYPAKLKAIFSVIPYAIPSP